MPEMITDIEDFFAHGCGRCDRFDTPQCSAMRWNPGLMELRRICRETGMTEHVKWGHPCYMHAGRNIVLIGALQGDFRLNFFHAALMKDPEGVLQRQGPNTQHPDSIKFADSDDVVRMEPILRAYIQEAMEYAELGIVPPKVERALDLPEELIDALDTDPEMAEAFHRLTPGRKRSYAIVIGGAKKSETRINRINKLRAKMLAGKGANEY